MKGAEWDVSQTRGRLAAGICVPLSVKVPAKLREEVWWRRPGNERPVPGFPGVPGAKGYCQ